SKYKNSYVIWGISSNYAELLEQHNKVDKLFRFKSFSEWIMLSQILDKIKWLTDETIDLHIDERRCLKYGKKLKKKVKPTHQFFFTTKNLLQAFSYSAGLPELNAAPTFFINPAKRHEGLPKNYLVFHTQSNFYLKDWQPEKWETLAVTLNEMGFYVVEVGLNQQIKKAGPKYIDFTGKQSLQVIANIIKEAAFFIGVDSGFAHMANALKKDGLVMIGHYRKDEFDFNYYNPFSGLYAHPHYILYPEKGRLNELAVSGVIERITPELQKIVGAGKLDSKLVAGS
ncbi:MAG TPA: glycosyltransferase family 9 protein, partial [Segetibacter sp.]